MKILEPTSSSDSFIHSFFLGATRQVPLVQQKLLILPEHLNSPPPPVLCGLFVVKGSHHWVLPEHLNSPPPPVLCGLFVVKGSHHWVLLLKTLSHLRALKVLYIVHNWVGNEAK